MADGPFTVTDFDVLSELVIDAWRSGVDRDWSVPAGTVEWSCFKTADHTVDCVFSYAFFLASRVHGRIPPFGELHALPEATPADLLDGLRASCTMLSAVIKTAPPDARATIRYAPGPVLGSPPDFAARGAHEMILHAYDVCTGLGITFDPPRDLCRRLWDHTREWPIGTAVTGTGDPWADLLVRSGRPELLGE